MRKGHWVAKIYKYCHLTKSPQTDFTQNGSIVASDTRSSLSFSKILFKQGKIIWISATMTKTGPESRIKPPPFSTFRHCAKTAF